MKNSIFVDFTIPTPNVYEKWNVLYNNLEKAKLVPWRAKPAYKNHYGMWFETEREDALETIQSLVPYDMKIYLIVDGIRKEQNEVI